MGRDYAPGCANFRDIGAWVNLMAGVSLLPEERLCRAAKLDFVQSAADIGHPETIINLRKGADRHTFGAQAYHCLISNRHEKYGTRTPEIRRWLNRMVHVFEDASPGYPVLMHWTSGKDRTGVVVAALLQVLDAPEAVMVEESCSVMGISKKPGLDKH